MKVVNKTFVGLFCGCSVIVDDVSLYDYLFIGTGSVSKRKPSQIKRRPLQRKKKRKQKDTINAVHNAFNVTIRPPLTRFKNMFRKVLQSAYTHIAETYKRKEVLVLDLCEAFFLVYGLGCLQVTHQNKPLSIEECWKMFCNQSESFILRYIVYHHFRSMGWVVRCGLKFGCDFVVYRGSPERYHAEYSVMVLHESQRLGWRDLKHLSRVTGNVSKDLVLCYVSYPKDTMEYEQVLKKSVVKKILTGRVLLTFG